MAAIGLGFGEIHSGGGDLHPPSAGDVRRDLVRVGASSTRWTWGQIWGEVGFQLLALASSSLAAAMAASWLGLALFGRWRAEPTWIDRAGRLLGGYWLLTGVLMGFGVLAGIAIGRR